MHTVYSQEIRNLEKKKQSGKKKRKRCKIPEWYFYAEVVCVTGTELIVLFFVFVNRN